jgi:hypothetical protein
MLSFQKENIPWIANVAWIRHISTHLLSRVNFDTGLPQRGTLLQNLHE